MACADQSYRPRRLIVAEEPERPVRLRRAVGVLVAAALAVLFGAVELVPAYAEVQIRTLQCGTGSIQMNTAFNPDTKQALVGADAVDGAWQVSGPYRGSIGTGLAPTWTDEQVRQLISDPSAATDLWIPLKSRNWAPSVLAAAAVGTDYKNRTGFTGVASAPISFDHTQTSQPEGSGGDNSDDFAFMYQFNLADGIDPAGVSVTVGVMSDNSVQAMWLNGVQPRNVEMFDQASGVGVKGKGLPQSGAFVGLNLPPYTMTSGGYFSTVALQGFRPGLNTLVVQVKSTPPNVWFRMVTQSVNPAITSPNGYVVCSPVLVADVASTAADTPVDVAVVANDGNVPSSATVTGVAPARAADGSWTVNPDNTVTFTPAAGFIGTATATYTLASPASAAMGTISASTGTASVSVNVGLQVAPDVAVTPAGTPVDIPVLDNDIVWADAVVTVPAGDPDQGVWSVGSDNRVRFAPAEGFAGTASATYTVTSPAAGQSMTESVSVEVVGVSVAVTPPAAPPSAAGQALAYTVKLTNPSAVSLTAGTVNTNFTGAGTAPTLTACALDDTQAAVTNGTIELQPGASATCTLSPYQVTQADLDAGTPLRLTATGAANGVLADHQPLPVTASASGQVGVTQNPGLTAAASPPPAATAPGQTVTFQTVITNTGNLTIDDAGLRLEQFDGLGDPITLGPCSTPDGQPQDNHTVRLAPGDTATCQATYTLTQADIDTSNTLTLTVLATGTQPDHTTITSQPATAAVDLPLPEPTPTPTPSVDPTSSPTPSVDPTSSPTPSVDPTSDPSPSVDPTSDPTPSVDPTSDPTSTPTDPGPTPSPTNNPTPIPAVTETVASGEAVVLYPDIPIPDGATVDIIDTDPTQGTWELNPDYSVTFTAATNYTGLATATYQITWPDGTTLNTQLEVTVTAATDQNDQDQDDQDGSAIGAGGDTLPPAAALTIGLILVLAAAALTGTGVLPRRKTAPPRKLAPPPRRAAAATTGKIRTSAPRRALATC